MIIFDKIFLIRTAMYRETCNIGKFQCEMKLVHAGT